MIIEATDQTKYLTDQIAKLLDERDRYRKALEEKAAAQKPGRVDWQALQ